MTTEALDFYAYWNGAQVADLWTTLALITGTDDYRSLLLCSPFSASSAQPQAPPSATGAATSSSGSRPWSSSSRQHSFPESTSP